MEIIMFKEWAAGPANTAGQNLTSKCRIGASIRKPIASTAILAGLLSVALLTSAVPAVAKPVVSGSCTKKYNACVSRCAGRVPKGTSTDKGNELIFACMARTCNKQYDNCVANSTTPGGGGKKTQTPGDPLNPKGAGNHTPPTGGNKSNPKSPPKVNDTRMPPRGGVHGSTTSGSGANTGGPILRSSGGGGQNFRSSARH